MSRISFIRKKIHRPVVLFLVLIVCCVYYLSNKKDITPSFLIPFNSIIILRGDHSIFVSREDWRQRSPEIFSQMNDDEKGVVIVTFFQIYIPTFLGEKDIGFFYNYYYIPNTEFRSMVASAEFGFNNIYNIPLKENNLKLRINEDNDKKGYIIESMEDGRSHQVVRFSSANLLSKAKLRRITVTGPYRTDNHNNKIHSIDFSYMPTVKHQGFFTQTERINFLESIIQSCVVVRRCACPAAVREAENDATSPENLPETQDDVVEMDANNE